MSSFSTDPVEYFDICICMLMDYIRRTEEFVKNDRWTKLMDRMLLLGMKAVVYMVYLTTDSQARIKYRLLAPALKGEGGCYIYIRDLQDKTVNVLPTANTVNKGLVKKIFKKVKEVRMKTSMPITEEKLDRIIDYVTKQEEQNG